MYSGEKWKNKSEKGKNWQIPGSNDAEGGRAGAKVGYGVELQVAAAWLVNFELWE